MPDREARQRRLTHEPWLSSDELIVLLEENVDDYAIIVTDTERCIINWNRGAERLFGYTVDEVLGKDSALIFTAADRDERVPQNEFRTATETGRVVDERYHLRKDGSRFWGSGVMTSLREDDGTVRGAVKILRDLTEQRDLEQTLRRQTEEARREKERAEAAAREVARLNAVLRRAMAETHHRIKNSFQMLSALLEVEIDGFADDSARSDYSKLSLHIRSLSAIHDLLTQEVKTDAELDHLGARTLLERLLQLLQIALIDRTIWAEIQEVSLSVRQGMSLAPLVNEIITNAIKYGAGDIQVSLRREGEVARLQISDQGPGFSADFDPAKAAHTGMELTETLARHDLRGEVHYGNTAEGGACVTVIFPVSST